MRTARYHVEMQANNGSWSEDNLELPIHADSIADAKAAVRELRSMDLAWSDETYRIVYYPAPLATPFLREVVALLLPGDHDREPAASTLSRLLKEAGMEGASLESTTVLELALRLQAVRDGVQVRCPRCAAGYSWAAFAYLEPTGFWTALGAEGEAISALTHTGPVFEGRLCKTCQAEFRVPRAKRPSKPFYKNLF